MTDFLPGLSVICSMCNRTPYSPAARKSDKQAVNLERQGSRDIGSAVFPALQN